MKRIGFIDLYISEWHANNYPEWIKNVCTEKGLDFKISYAWAERDISPVDGRSTDEWCRDFGVEKCLTIDELCEKSDFIIILAPSNPEVHLRYAEAALKYGKPTYIDKTFAPDYKTALEIFSLAKKYGAPFFSSSALRFADELNTGIAPIHIETEGGGSSLEEYIIHQCEMVIKKLGIGVDTVSAKCKDDKIAINVKFSNGKSAKMTYNPDLPFSFSEVGEQGERTERTQIKSSFFNSLIADIVEFFDCGRIPFDTNETKEVIKLVELSVKARQKQII